MFLPQLMPTLPSLLKYDCEYLHTSTISTGTRSKIIMIITFASKLETMQEYLKRTFLKKSVTESHQRNRITIKTFMMLQHSTGSECFTSKRWRGKIYFSRILLFQDPVVRGFYCERISANLLISSHFREKNLVPF